MRQILDFCVDLVIVPEMDVVRKEKNPKEKKRTYTQTRLIGRYNAKWLFSLIYVSKPLITNRTAIEPSFRTDCFPFFSLLIKGNRTFFRPINRKIAPQLRENQQ